MVPTIAADAILGAVAGLASRTAFTLTSTAVHPGFGPVLLAIATTRFDTNIVDAHIARAIEIVDATFTGWAFRACFPSAIRSGFTRTSFAIQARLGLTAVLDAATLDAVVSYFAQLAVLARLAYTPTIGISLTAIQLTVGTMITTQGTSCTSGLPPWYLERR